MPADLEGSDSQLTRAVAKEHGTWVRPNQLCRFCRYSVTASKHFRGQRKAGIEEFVHTHSWGHLAWAAWDGCHLCSLFERALTPDVGQPRLQRLKLFILAPAQIDRAFAHITERRDGSEIFCMVLAQGTTFEVSRYSILFVRNAQDSRQQKTRFSPDVLLDSTGSFHATGLVKFWLWQCVAHHKFCSQTIGVRRLPSRLLKISTKPPCLCVVSTMELPLTTEYVTLSYVWGDCKADLSIFWAARASPQGQLSIKLSSLPQTLQDSISLTSRLGFEYLWVDRLCIDQTSSADFKHEIARMGSYYENGALNLAALSAASARDRMITYRNPLSSTPMFLGGPSEMELEINSHKNRTVHHLNSHPFDRANLLSRAWVLQERVLAPRTVYYSHGEHAGLLWECREGCGSENVPGALHSVFDLQPGRRVFKGQLYTALKAASKKQDLQDVWHVLLEEYVGCSLSDGTDRWNAFAGITELLGWLPGEVMRYGLRLDDLPRQLLWKSLSVFTPSKTSPYSSGGITNVGPSWSWLSVPHPVDLAAFKLSSESPLHTSESTLSHRQTAPRLSRYQDDGSLVQAKTVPIPVHECSGRFPLGCQVLMSLPIVRVTRIQGYLGTMDSTAHGWLENGFYVALYFDFIDYSLRSDLYLLPIWLQEDQFHGLIIRRQLLTGDYWTRCGIFRSETQHHIDDFMDVLNAQLDRLQRPGWPSQNRQSRIVLV